MPRSVFTAIVAAVLAVTPATYSTAAQPVTTIGAVAKSVGQHQELVQYQYQPPTQMVPKKQPPAQIQPQTTQEHGPGIQREIIIGTTSAIGGLVGTAFGPWGTVAGTALGAGAGAIIAWLFR